MTAQYKYDLLDGEAHSVVRLAKELVDIGWEPASPITVVVHRHSLFAYQWMRVAIGRRE